MLNAQETKEIQAGRKYCLTRAGNGGTRAVARGPVVAPLLGLRR